MASGTAESPKNLIGASIPRSGHHFLQNLLSSYFAKELFYCEFYTPAGCCKTVPCSRRGEHRVIYQKSHDRDQETRPDVSDALYLIQYRHPVPEALSDRELELVDGLSRRNVNYRYTRDNYAQWLADKAIYYRKFHDKWMVNRLNNAVYIDYTLLSGDPAAVLRDIIGWAAGEVDEPRLQSIIDKASATRVSVKFSTETPKVFKPRVIQDSPNFDAELLAAFEAWVLERSPKFGFQRELTGGYEKTELYGLILLYDLDEPLPAGERNRFAAAAKYAPDHPEIQRRLAQKSLRDGDVGAAVRRMQRALTRNPFYTAGYKMVLSVCRRNDMAIPDSVLTADAILACAENPTLLTDLGAAFLEKGRVINAIAALSLATVVAPDYQRAFHLLASTLSGEKKWSQARDFAQRAVELDKENKSSASLLAMVQSRLGQAPAR